MARGNTANPFYTDSVTLSSLRVLEQLAYLNTHARKRQNRLHPALHPTRAWLARRCRCSITTISRATSKLATDGHLRKAQTRSTTGNWRPTWYWLAAGAADQIRFALARILRRPRRVSSMAHLTRGNISVTPTPTSGGDPPRESSLTSWLKRARAADAAGNTNPDAPPPAGEFGRGQ